MKIYDISPNLSEETAVFPGDQPFLRNVALDFNNGQNLFLTSFTTSSHLGAHADAPAHYHKTGKTIEERSLKYYLGKVQVIEVSIPRGNRIKVEDIKNIKIQAERVLFKTLSFPNPDNWNNDFNSFSPELIDYLAKSGVILVGIDTPSVDPWDDSVLLSHGEIYKNDMAVLEGIVLDEVSPGVYFLSALPLKIKGGDAGLVRAVLIEKGDLWS